MLLINQNCELKIIFDLIWVEMVSYKILKKLKAILKM